ncbi:MAG TPA: hypothetical protein VGA53_03090 [Candidatus Paceibacterota bacterium]
MTKANKKNNQSLLTDAFEALLEKLGPEKAIQVWQILVPPHGDYTRLRKKLFAGKDADALDREIRKFNHK